MDSVKKISKKLEKMKDEGKRCENCMNYNRVSDKSGDCFKTGAWRINADNICLFWCWCADK